MPRTTASTFFLSYYGEPSFVIRGRSHKTSNWKRKWWFIHYQTLFVKFTMYGEYQYVLLWHLKTQSLSRDQSFTHPMLWPSVHHNRTITYKPSKFLSLSTSNKFDFEAISLHGLPYCSTEGPSLTCVVEQKNKSCISNENVCGWFFREWRWRNVNSKHIWQKIKVKIHGQFRSFILMQKPFV